LYAETIEEAEALLDQLPHRR